MTNQTLFLRFFAGVTLLTATLLIAGCSSPEKETTQVTTERTISTPAPAQQPAVSTTTTTTKQTQP